MLKAIKKWAFFPFFYFFGILSPFSYFYWLEVKKMNIKKLDFISKKNLVRDACKFYNRIKNIQLSDEILKKYDTSAKNILEMNKTTKVKSIFEQILNLLSPTSYMIIDNFF